MNNPTRKIPDSFIYEMVDGQPIYYRGYKEALRERKDAEEIMGSSYLQSLIVTNLVIQLAKTLPPDLQILTNELGVLFSKRNWRAADIAIVDKSILPAQQNEKAHLTAPPKIVIEVDTKAELEDQPHPSSYYFDKTDQLLAFGVEKVIWIFTELQKVMVAEKDKPWLTVTWNDPVSILEEIEICVKDLAI